MLELYRVSDSVQLEEFISTQGSEHNLEQIYLGMIRLEEHLKLVEAFPQAKIIPFFEDSHLKSDKLKDICEACQQVISKKNLPADTLDVLNSLALMIEKAINHNEGIIALCD